MSELKFKSKQQIIDFTKEKNPNFFSVENVTTLREKFYGILKGSFFVTGQKRTFGQYKEIFQVRQVMPNGDIKKHENPFNKLDLQGSFSSLYAAKEWIKSNAYKYL